MKFLLNALFINKLGIAAITLSTSLVTLINATLLGCILLKKINLGYKSYFISLSKMIGAAIIAFSINWGIYSVWTIDTNNWFLLLFKTLTIFVLSMTTYVALSAIFKIEFVGELIERIKNYIRRKFNKQNIK